MHIFQKYFPYKKGLKQTQEEREDDNDSEINTNIDISIKDILEN